MCLLLYPSNTTLEAWRNLMTFETPESGMGLVQKKRRKALGKAQNRGKLSHRMVFQMRKTAL